MMLKYLVLPLALLCAACASQPASTTATPAFLGSSLMNSMIRGAL